MIHSDETPRQRPRFGTFPTLTTFGLLLIPWIFGCSAEDSGAMSAARPNVLLITVDTLRADHLGIHGYGRATSPRIDEFASQAIVFENAQAAASWTLPGLASIMTSRFSSGHGCWDSTTALSSSTTTLATILRDEGYDTACVVSHLFLTQRFGLQQGFTHFDDELDFPNVHPHENRSSPRVSARGTRWLEQKVGVSDGLPWFLWLHYFDPHDTYLEHAGHSEAFEAENEVDLYDGEIHYTDYYIGEVLDALSRTGQDQNTIVILTADHGEEFRDHGGLKHGRTLYREQLHVPLVIALPEGQPRRVPDLVRTVDIVPTVLDLVEGPRLSDQDGQSLLSLMNGEPHEPLPALAELRLRKHAHYDALVQGNWKLIVDARTDEAQLFDLATDPTEQENLAASQAARVSELRQEMRRMIESSSRRSGSSPANRLEHSPAELEVLRDLGYVGGEAE